MATGRRRFVVRARGALVAARANEFASSTWFQTQVGGWDLVAEGARHRLVAV